MSVPKEIPRHIAIIMDGNGRWAAERGLPKIAGHRAGVDAVRRVVQAAKDIGIKALTLYAFSTENWKRPEIEVKALFGLLAEYLDKEEAKLKENGVRFTTIGRINELPQVVRDRIARVVAATKGNSDVIMNLALNYGGRAEIVDAARSLAREARDGLISPDAIDDALFAKHLYTAGLPDPDILIRTSGEFRISNYLLWQLSYAEIFIIEKYWPDFGKDDLAAVISDYRNRDRRYGG